MIAPDMSDQRFGAKGSVLSRLLDSLQRGPQLKPTIEYAIWGEHAPPHRNNLSHHIWRLNQLLKPMGWRVKCKTTRAIQDRGRSPGRSGSRVSTYRLISCPPTLATKPAHKTFDPEGVYVG